MYWVTIISDHYENNELGQEFQLQFVPVDTLVTPSRVIILLQILQNARH